jgi:hypothetical protein
MSVLHGMPVNAYFVYFFACERALARTRKNWQPGNRALRATPGNRTHFYVVESAHGLVRRANFD